MKYMISSAERSVNYPIYTTPTDLDSFILCNTETDNEIKTELREEKKTKNNDKIGRAHV